MPIKAGDPSLREGALRPQRSRKLRRFLAEHEVFTADEMRWASLKDGRLLRVAEEAGFGVMITGDKNLKHQQNLSGRKLAILVLQTVDWNLLKLNLQPILSAVEAATPGSLQVLS